MKKINFIILLVFVCTLYSSCNNDNEEMQEGDPEFSGVIENGYSFNNEFFPTDELVFIPQLDIVLFFIIDDTAEFNGDRAEFEENSGKGIIIGIPFDEVPEELIDLSGTFTNAIGINSISGSMNGDFVAVAFSGLENIDLDSDFGSNFIEATDGEVLIEYNEGTEEFGINFLFTTDEGTFSGSHISRFIPL